MLDGTPGGDRDGAEVHCGVGGQERGDGVGLADEVCAVVGAESRASDQLSDAGLNLNGVGLGIAQFAFGGNLHALYPAHHPVISVHHPLDYRPGYPEDEMLKAR